MDIFSLATIVYLLPEHFGGYTTIFSRFIDRHNLIYAKIQVVSYFLLDFFLKWLYPLTLIAPGNMNLFWEL